jgi:hypothetical protein
MPPHHGSLTRGQGGVRARGVGPGGAAPLREALCTPPIALPIVNQAFERRTGAMAKDVDGPTARMLRERLAAYRRHARDALPEIDGRDGQQETTLWGQLEPQDASKNVRLKVVREPCGSRECIRSHAPSARWSAIAVSGVESGHAETAGTSTTPCGGREVSPPEAAWEAAQCWCKSRQLTRNDFATRDRGHTVVRATACSHSAGGIGAARVGRQ